MLRNNIIRIFFICITTVSVFSISLPLNAKAPSNEKLPHIGKLPSPNTNGLDAYIILIRRIWMTEYNKGKHIYYNLTGPYNRKLCYEELGLDKGLMLPPIENENENLLIWEYKCTPTILVFNSPVNKNTVEARQMKLAMLYFDGVEKVIPALLEILQTNKLGKYTMSPEILNKIKSKKYFTPQAYKIENWFWDDFPNTDNIPSITSINYKYYQAVKTRMQMLKINPKEFKRDGNFIYYTVDVPENFLQPW